MEKQRTGGKMSDEELSRQLGRCQRSISIWILTAIIGAAAGTVLLFTMHSRLPALAVYVLSFGGAFVFGGGAQKKQKQLLQEQLGDFFRTELELAFGPEMHTEAMRIDLPWLRQAALADVQWEECETESFREGMYDGIHFSAANTVLKHVTEHIIGREGKTTHAEPVFTGLVLRLETQEAAPGTVRVTPRCAYDPAGFVSIVDEDFERRFRIQTDSVQAARRLLTPGFRKCLEELEAQTGLKPVGLLWQGHTLSLALETRYRFAVVPDSTDLRDLAELRRRYIGTLKTLEQLLDFLNQEKTLFSTDH